MNNQRSDPLRSPKIERTCFKDKSKNFVVADQQICFVF